MNDLNDAEFAFVKVVGQIEGRLLGVGPAARDDMRRAVWHYSQTDDQERQRLRAAIYRGAVDEAGAKEGMASADLFFDHVEQFRDTVAHVDPGRVIELWEIGRLAARCAVQEDPRLRRWVKQTRREWERDRQARKERKKRKRDERKRRK